MIKKLVDFHSSTLYHFNWQLYLDEDKASEMTEEVFKLALQSEVFLESYANELDETSKIRLKLFQLAYELYTNSYMAFKSKRLNGHWSRLDPIQRSALFLKHRCHLNYRDMEMVYKTSPAKLINLTHQARGFLLEGRSDLC